MVPRLLRGDETWCQGFSEPGTGSNLAALVLPGRRATDDGWRVTGQKVWTSLAQYAQRCVLLTRTGHARVGPPGHHRAVRRHGHARASPSARSRRCTARRSSARSSSTTSLVPFDRTLGDEGQGWAVAMDLLPFERSTALWHRGAYLHRRAASSCSTAAPTGALDADRGRRGVPAALRLPGPLARHAAPAGRRRAARARDVDRQDPAGHRRAGGLRPRRSTASPTTSLLGDDAGRRAVALGVPLLAGRHDLRRQRRDPAQHHRPPPPRPRSRTADGRRGPRALRQGHPARHRDVIGRRRSTPPSTSSAGTTPCADDRRATVATAVRAPGRGRRPRRRRSTSCMADALGVDARRSTGVVLPPLGRIDRAGRSADGRRVRGHRPRRARRPSAARRRRGRRRRPHVVDTADARRCDRSTASTPASAWSRSPATSSRPTRSTPPADVARRRGRRPAGPRPRAGRRVADDARSWPASTPSSASSSTGRSPRSRPSATGWPRASSPSRPPTPPLDAAWDDGTPLTAALAKAVAGRSARTVARHCQQVLAGIGFTTEHALHRYVRRALVLDHLLGDARSLTRRLGEDLLARRTLPSILPL